MQLWNLLTATLLFGAACASPGGALCTGVPYGYGPSGGCGFSNTTSSALPTNTTLTSTSTSTTSSSITTAVGPITSPTSSITVVSARSGSPIHFLRMNARGLRFWLGGDTLSYCPEEVEQIDACPPGNETVFDLCNMAALVPGGQQIYMSPTGEIAYTAPHSSFMPAGSVTCPFTYIKAAQAPFGLLSTLFGGFMACPTSGNTWQVFANLQNATVPQGNVSQCLGFDALAIDSTEIYAAWEYL
ncbi:hypothetical protein PV11_00969 [Exophiala sideris]|uniref:Ubiquitin 3 binding protein But2 C-terminal domain-containing protein n=1 Tax=Exophiala sideris TaxID=1016849 RepID=A0A0D1YR86_9EURO|nr:hypothetical protein PV11_00969 [Exophiala sideris]